MEECEGEKKKKGGKHPRSRKDEELGKASAGGGGLG